MVNFDPLTAEIGSWVWGTPANFIGFRVLLLQSSTAEIRRGKKEDEDEEEEEEEEEEETGWKYNGLPYFIGRP